MQNKPALFLAALGALGCSGPGPGPADAGDGFSLEERDLSERGGHSSNATQQLAKLADGMFDFDPTIDPAKTAAENASAIQANTTINLNGCGSATLNGTTVTLSAPAPGCTLKNGVNVQGTVSLSVTKSGSTTTVTLTLTSVVVNGVSVSGTASFATSNGTTFTVTGDVTSGSTTYTMNLTVAGSTGSTTINGTSTAKSGDSTNSMTFTNVVWKVGECYPSSGSLKVTKALVTSTITFDSSTPTTGKVSVTSGRKTQTMQLPAYGNCPPGADGG